MKVPPALVAALALGLLTGCAQRVATGSAPLTTTVSVAPHPSYGPISAADACPEGAPVHLPADVGGVTRAYVCVQEFRPIAGDGEWQFSVVRGVTSGIEDLVRAYRTPDAGPSDGACAAIGVVPPVVYFHGSRILAVRGPLDGCGMPTEAGTRAYEALGTIQLTATKLRRVTSQLAQTSGCSDQYKDMLAIEESSGGPRQVSTTPTALGRGAELCVYAVSRDPQGDRLGQLSAARQLTGTDTARINSELTRATVDASCARHQHTRFALVQTTGNAGGPTTLVALDGCAVEQDGGWWRATDRLRALVTG